MEMEILPLVWVEDLNMEEMLMEEVGSRQASILFNKRRVVRVINKNDQEEEEAAADVVNDDMCLLIKK